MLELATILAALSPRERLMAVRDKDPWQVAVSWTVWVPVVVAMVAGVALIALYRWYLSRRRAQQAFAEAADGRNLNQEERRVLAKIVSAARLGRLNAIYDDDVAFERGAIDLMASPPLRAMSEAQRGHVEGVIDALREKLGFTERVPDERRPAPAVLPRGVRITILRRNVPGLTAAVVMEVGASRITVRPESPVQARPGEAWRLRHVTPGLQWEFDTAVVEARDGRVVLQRIGEPRCINLRRFLRVPTHTRAMIAPFPFVTGAGEADTPKFVPGIVTEIAGRGLRVDSPLKTRVGDRVLVVFWPQPGKCVQSLSVVRRSTQANEGICVSAVEMIGLSDAEVGELVRETNQAARQAEGEADQPEEVLVDAEQGEP
jgi:uncharacterized membrane protein